MFYKQGPSAEILEYNDNSSVETSKFSWRNVEFIYILRKWDNKGVTEVQNALLPGNSVPSRKLYNATLKDGTLNTTDLINGIQTYEFWLKDIDATLQLRPSEVEHMPQERLSSQSELELGSR